MSISTLLSKVIYISLYLKACFSIGINKFQDMRSTYKILSATFFCVFFIASAILLVSKNYTKSVIDTTVISNSQKTGMKIYPSSFPLDSAGPDKSMSETRIDNVSLESDKPTSAFSNILDFIDYIDSVNSSEIEIRKVIDYTENSTEAFNHIKNAFWMTDDLDLRHIYLYILDNSEIEEKYDIAIELADSPSISERKMAYEWLSHSVSSSSPQLQGKLINAFETETDTDLLVDLISIVKTHKQDNVVSDRVISRIKDLSYHSNERVSASAIVMLGQIAQNKSTLDFIMPQIESISPAIQLASIQSLHFFDYPGDDIVESLRVLSANPSAPQNVRAAAVGAIVTFENYANANKE